MFVLYLAMGLFGLAIGSFLNVVIGRVPRGESVVQPASHCPRCLATIRRRHNVPVLGWLMLRGRCADCSLPISTRYPVVEAVTATLFMITAARLDRLDLEMALPAYLVGVCAAIVVLAMDLDGVAQRSLAPAYVTFAIALGVGVVAEHDGARFVRGVVLAIAVGTAWFAVATFAGTPRAGTARRAIYVAVLAGFLGVPTSTRQLVVAGIVLAILVISVLTVDRVPRRADLRRTPIPQPA